MISFVVLIKKTLYSARILNNCSDVFSKSAFSINKPASFDEFIWSPSFVANGEEATNLFTKNEVLHGKPSLSY